MAKTKGEIAEYITKTKGKLFINVDFLAAANLAVQYKKSVGVSVNKFEGADIFAKNISSTKKGSTFDLCYGEDVQKCTTILLGQHNISNILQFRTDLRF